MPYCIIDFFPHKNQKTFFLAHTVLSCCLHESSLSRETPTYFFLGLIALTCLVEYALVVEQLIVAMDDLDSGISTFACRLFTYFSYGNRIMQVQCCHMALLQCSVTVWALFLNSASSLFTWHLKKTPPHEYLPLSPGPETTCWQL